MTPQQHADALLAQWQENRDLPPHRRLCQIRTWHEYPPIPDRNFDYGAAFEDDEPDDDGHMLVGWGSTPEEAIADLIASCD